MAFNATNKKVKKQMIRKLKSIGPYPIRDRKKDFELGSGSLRGKMAL